MATLFPTTVPTKRLAASISGAATTFQVNNILGWDGVALTAADFGTKAYGVFRNDSNTLMEIFEFDPATIASASISFIRRGLKFTGDLTTEVAANKLTWVRNETIVEFGTDVPQLLKHAVQVIDDQTVSGIKTFDETTMPRLSAQHTYGASQEEFLATKRYVDAVAAAGTPDATTTAKGLAEEATEAEIEAGTAAGSEGRLFVNPSTLKSSDYGTKVYGRYGDYAVDSGSGDSYAVTLAPVPAAYNTGMTISFKPAVSNTGACTINVNSLGVKNIKIGSADPSDSALTAGQVHELVYDGTNFQLINPSQSSQVPTGSVWMWTTTTAPSGWLLADGSAVSRTTYAALFAVISTTYGVGDGSTTFNVPNLKGKVPVGLDSAQTEFDALAETGGAKTHTLTSGEMPAHTHDVTTGTGAGTGLLGRLDNVSSGTIATSSTGGGGAHNNLQPYVVLNFIIKT